MWHKALNYKIFKLFKTRMSKETQLSQTAGAQVSSNIWIKKESKYCFPNPKISKNVKYLIHKKGKNVVAMFLPQVAEVANIMQNNVDKLLER